MSRNTLYWEDEEQFRCWWEGIGRVSAEDLSSECVHAMSNMKKRGKIIASEEEEKYVRRGMIVKHTAERERNSSLLWSFTSAVIMARRIS
jgi:hypothetical protein